MKEEIEVKFLNVDFEDVRKKLQKLGAQCEQPMRLMRRAIMDTPGMDFKKKQGYVRVRDEGHKITLTYKQFDEGDFHVSSAKEIEVIVNAFDDTISLLKATGLRVISVQESKRETWRLGNVEIVLDEWPWLNPYIEIEGESESDIRKVAAMLGFEWKDAMFGDVMVAYRKQYPYLKKGDGKSVGRVKEVKFGTPLPDLLAP